MRTTVDIDDDVLALARALAEETRVSLGRALSLLARRGLQPVAAAPGRHGLPVFEVPADAPTIPIGRARELLADDGVEDETP